MNLTLTSGLRRSVTVAALAAGLAVAALGRVSHVERA